MVESMDSGDVERRISVQACNVLNDLRRSTQLCDAVLKVDDGYFPVHRAIMSACSPYFRALFTNGMHETDQREVFIPGITADMMGVIVEYAYTRAANVTAENVERLLPAADQFHVLGLVKLCTEFLAGQLDWDNCVGIRTFARYYFCTELERKATRYIMEYFSEIGMKSNEILNLTCDQLCEILDSDDLNIKNEETVFDVVIRWINHDPGERRQHILPLLRCIRLGLLSTAYFVETVKNHPYVKENEACRPLIIETLKFLYDLDMTDKEVDLTHPLARPRVPHEIMVVVGGWSGGSPTNVIETYDTRADRWIVCDHPDRGHAYLGPRAYHGCATVEMKVYVIGGFDGMDYFNSCRRFDPVAKEWQEIAPMNARRCYVSVAVLSECIYAMGGFDGHVRQNTAEKYTPDRNQWSLITPMNHQRSDASATTCGKKIFICGGFNGQECLNTAEHYDPGTNQWTMITPMRNRRSGIGVISHDGMVYAVGGFNGITRMNNGEKFNPATNTWSNISEMYSPRSNFGIEVIDDMVFAIGGFNGVTTIYNVECYDPATDEWYDCTDMNIYRSALSACIVRGLPNVRDYIHKERGKADSKRKTTPATNAAAAAAAAAAAQGGGHHANHLPPLAANHPPLIQAMNNHVMVAPLQPMQAPPQAQANNQQPPPQHHQAVQAPGTPPAAGQQNNPPNMH